MGSARHELYKTPHDDFARELIGVQRSPQFGTVLRGGFASSTISATHSQQCVQYTNFPFATISFFPNVSLSALRSIPAWAGKPESSVWPSFCLRSSYDLPFTMEYNLTVEHHSEIMTCCRLGMLEPTVIVLESDKPPEPYGESGPAFTRIDLVSPNEFRTIIPYSFSSGIASLRVCRSWRPIHSRSHWMKCRTNPSSISKLLPPSSTPTGLRPIVL